MICLHSLSMVDPSKEESLLSLVFPSPPSHSMQKAVGAQCRYIIHIPQEATICVQVKKFRTKTNILNNKLTQQSQSLILKLSTKPYILVGNAILLGTEA